jgi:hypothetical protein
MSPPVREPAKNVYGAIGPESVSILIVELQLDCRPANAGPPTT